MEALLWKDDRYNGICGAVMNIAANLSPEMEMRDESEMDLLKIVGNLEIGINIDETYTKAGSRTYTVIYVLREMRTRT